MSEPIEAEAWSAPQTAPEAEADSGQTTTGDTRVDAALARLSELDALPTVDQVPVLEDIHRRLQDALAELDGS